jgi:predicted ATP-dependent endonuclease of OLD family
MLISKIQVLNYKSFRDSDWIEFRPGINLVVGQNSAGKTALLEALTLVFENTPHKSLKTLPTAAFQLRSESIVDFSLDFSEQEIRELLSQIPENQYCIPRPQGIQDADAIKLFQELLVNI